MKKRILTVLMFALLLVSFLFTNVYAGTYTAIRIDSPPTIDGNIAEFSSATSIEITNNNGAVGFYQFMWDSTALYIAATVEDTELSAIYVNRDDPLYNDDSIELFFDTLNNDGPTRQADDYKFFVNALNVQADSRGTGGMTSFDANFVSAAIPAGTMNISGDLDIGYTLEIAIPWAEWGIAPPEDGTIFGFDVGMNDRRDDIRTQEFWTNSVGNANNPSGWGKMVFSQDNPWIGPLLGAVSVSAVWDVIVPPTTVDITFVWDASTGADGYRMFSREAGKSYNYDTPNWDGPSTTCVLLDLPIHEDRYFVVRAYNSFGESGDSNEVFYQGGN